MRSTICLAFIFIVGAIIGCTKDIVPNPSTSNSNLGTQKIIYDENFDEPIFPAWPIGWSADANGWVMDSSSANSSTAPGLTTYPGASGNYMIDISNPTAGSGGTYTVTSKMVSTVGFTNITVIYGARNSKHWGDNGSKITKFEWSGDGGNTWNAIPFSENPNDSNWYLINNGTRMALSSSAAGINIQFRWTANVVATASGTYRIDDFQVYGSAN